MAGICWNILITENSRNLRLKEGGILVELHRKLIRCTLYEYELAPYVSIPLLYYILNCITRNGNVININKYIHKNKQVSFLLATPWCS